MKVSDLKANTSNPRKMDAKSRGALQKSLEKFGDLNCIVFNRRTKSLIGGHQRTKSFPPETTVKIEKKYDSPNHCMTVAEGYIEVAGERFKYREVEASEKWETEAMLAANRHSGEWDNELLRLNFSNFPDLDLELTGFSLDEMDDLGVNIAPIDPSLLLNQGAGENKEESDFQWIKNDKGHDQEADREKLPDLLNRTYPPKDGPEDITDIDPLTHSKGEEGQENDPFEEAGKETTVNKRHVLIIDCDSDEIKKTLKEKISPMVNEANAKFF